GESVAEATIVKWVIEEGDSFEADDPIIEIATEKVDSEVPAPEAGVLVKKLCDEGDVVAVGKPIAIMSTGGGAAPASAGKAAAAVEKPAPAEVQSNASHTQAERQAVPETATIGRTGASGRFYAPLVRNIAKEEGIGMSELEAISGSGREGRVTKSD